MLGSGLYGPRLCKKRSGVSMTPRSRDGARLFPRRGRATIPLCPSSKPRRRRRVTSWSGGSIRSACGSRARRSSASCAQLYRELERKGLRHFRPVCYLTDEWGCPDRRAGDRHPLLPRRPAAGRASSATMNDLEDEREIMMYLRHEAGHAFNYAYRLYRRREWRELFGPFHRPLPRRLPPGPVLPPVRAPHRGLVRAEASRRGLRRDLRGLADAALELARRATRAGRRSRKLRYVDRMARRCATSTPPVPSGDFDVTVEEMESTVEEFYRQAGRDENSAAVDAGARRRPADIFVRAEPPAKGVRPGGRPPRASTARRSSTRSPTGPGSGARWCARSSSASIERLPRARAAARTGARAGAAGRAHRLRHHARDELPDAREVRAVVLRREPYEPESCSIGVLYDDWWDEDEERAAGEPRPKRKQPAEDVAGDLRGAQEARPRAGLPAARRHGREPARAGAGASAI